MDRIFYGLAGEGLGHASRTLAVIDALPDMEVHLFTFGKAYDFLHETGYPHLHRINGIMFPYKNGKINYARLAYESAVMEDLKYAPEPPPPPPLVALDPPPPPPPPQPSIKIMDEPNGTVQSTSDPELKTTVVDM